MGISIRSLTSLVGKSGGAKTAAAEAVVHAPQTQMPNATVMAVMDRTGDALGTVGRGIGNAGRNAVDAAKDAAAATGRAIDNGAERTVAAIEGSVDPVYVAKAEAANRLHSKKMNLVTLGGEISMRESERTKQFEELLKLQEQQSVIGQFGDPQLQRNINTRMQRVTARIQELDTEITKLEEIRGRTFADVTKAESAARNAGTDVIAQRIEGSIDEGIVAAPPAPADAAFVVPEELLTRARSATTGSQHVAPQAEQGANGGLDALIAARVGKIKTSDAFTNLGAHSAVEQALATHTVGGPPAPQAPAQQVASATAPPQAPQPSGGDSLTLDSLSSLLPQ